MSRDDGLNADSVFDATRLGWGGGANGCRCSVIYGDLNWTSQMLMRLLCLITADLYSYPLPAHSLPRFHPLRDDKYAASALPSLRSAEVPYAKLTLAMPSMWLWPTSELPRLEKKACRTSCFLFLMLSPLSERVLKHTVEENTPQWCHQWCSVMDSVGLTNAVFVSVYFKTW